MLRLRDRPVRIYLGGALVLLLGLSAYPVGRRIWASREYDAACQELERYDYWQASAHLENYLLRPSDERGRLVPGSADGPTAG